MNDELKRCSACEHDHPWGILRYSPDNTPLYGARSCEVCECNTFMSPEVAELMKLPPAEVKALWEDTSFLNAQVPAATRIAVRQIMSQVEGASDLKALTTILPEFMSLMISQVTDIRGALVRDDSKFAHLVAHTDEIVESMRGVVQLSERLQTNTAYIKDVAERQDRIERMLTALCRHLSVPLPETKTMQEEEEEDWSVSDDEAAAYCSGDDNFSLCQRCGHIRAHHDEDTGECAGDDRENAPECHCSGYGQSVPAAEARATFLTKTRDLMDEPVDITSDE